MGHGANPITRRSLMGFMAALVVRASAVTASADEVAITVHKDPNCGCCTGWVQHLRDSGFTVRVEETSDLDLVRKRLGVPTELAACHTAEVAGYLVEGHVPAETIRRLLVQRPNARGIAVPGMPAGSPGMEAAHPQSYTVFLFGSDGHRPFMRFRGIIAADG